MSVCIGIADIILFQVLQKPFGVLCINLDAYLIYLCMYGYLIYVCLLDIFISFIHEWILNLFMHF